MAVRIQASAVPFLALCLAFAGCTGPPPGPAEDTVPATAAPPTGDAETCTIAGQIVDEEDVPVSEAQVGLLGENPLTTKTAADGRFGFSFVPPGRYQLGASKIGYETTTEAASCEAGASVDALLKLKLLPPTTIGHYVLLQPLTGFIGCGAGMPGMSGALTGDLCFQAGVDRSGKTQFPLDFIVNETITAMVFQLDWTPSGGFGGKYLRMVWPEIATEADYSTDDRIDLTNEAVQGPSPLDLTIRSVDGAESLLARDSTAMVEVRMSSSNTTAFAADGLSDQSSLLVYQQSFTLYAAFFYNGFAVPADFSLGPE